RARASDASGSAGASAAAGGSKRSGWSGMGAFGGSGGSYPAPLTPFRLGRPVRSRPRERSGGGLDGAVGFLPGVQPALDVRHVRHPHLLRPLRGERRAASALAVEDDLLARDRKSVV